MTQRFLCGQRRLITLRLRWRTCHLVSLCCAMTVTMWAATWQNQQNDYAPSEDSSLCTSWVAKDPRFLHVDSEDSDQTVWMPRLIQADPSLCWTHTHFVGFVISRLMCCYGPFNFSAHRIEPVMYLSVLFKQFEYSQAMRSEMGSFILFLPLFKCS